MEAFRIMAGKDEFAKRCAKVKLNKIL